MLKLCARLALLLLASAWVVTGGAQVRERHYSYYDSSSDAVKTRRTVEQYHYGKGVDKMEAGHWSLAMGEWTFILRYIPDHPQALNQMSLAALKAGSPARAEEFFETAMRMYPTTATTYAVYGIHLYRLGEIDRAIEAYKQSLALDPRAPEAHYNLGVTYAAAGEHRAANRHAQAAYHLGYPLPGLRNKLKRAGAWQELSEEELSALVTSDE